MAMNQAALEKFENRIKPGGLLAYNETVVDTLLKRRNIKIVPIPANEIAVELGNLQVANMAAVGGLVTALGVFPLHSLFKGLTRVIPKHRHHLIPLNEEAMRRGMQAVRGNMKGMRI
jgi:2-oxoglutarate ferredoxin oxidoreductase subunit gamma